MTQSNEVSTSCLEKSITADACKRKGNEFFKAGDFPAAIRCYSDAIAINGENHVYFGNRSAAHGCNGDWESAAVDARASVDLDPTYTKGFYRLAQALINIGDRDKAGAAIEAGLVNDPRNREMLSLRKSLRGETRVSGGGQGRNPREPRTGTKKVLDLASLSLYDDKEGLEEGGKEGVPIDDDARALRRMFRSLRESAGAPGGDALGADGHPPELEGVFRQMKNPEEFRRMVMPGLSDEERRGVPNTFQELLQSPLYAPAVESSLPRVVAKAASVLEGVKERGRKAGDIMDAATEEILKPQILQEAFAREVVKVVSAVHATVRAKAASERGRLASPSCEEATWDQLEHEAVKDLLAEGKGYAVQDSFLGEGWAPVLLEDSVRFQGHGKFGPVGLEPKHGEMAWVEAGELESKYPALYELVTCLHALPFELNLKEPNLSLARPFRGSTMLLRLTEGCQIPPRLDCFAGGVETGHKISAVFFIGRKGAHDGDESNTANGGGQLRLQNVTPAAMPSCKGSSKAAGTAAVGESRKGDADGSCIPSQGNAREERDSNVEDVEPRPGRLVLFRSDLVSTQTLEVRGHGQEQYAVLFWMHGAVEGEI